MDPMQKVTPGQPVKIQAETWNQVIDSARDHTRRVSSHGGPPTVDTSGSQYVTIKNNSGGTVNRFGILAITSPIVDPTGSVSEFQAKVNFVGEEPSDSATECIAILQEPLKDQQIGKAIIFGVAVVRVNMLDAAHRYATLTPGQPGYLTSTASANAPAKIFWVESSTGEKWAYIELSQKAPCGTTSTTTTAQPCSGYCTWSWNNSTKVWTNTGSSCLNCVCIPPAYCGSRDCEITRTWCSQSGGPATPPCAGTTSTTTSTTTATPGDCAGSCRWRKHPNGNWVRIEGDCQPASISGGQLSWCACASPDSSQGGDCEETHTPCVRYTQSIYCEGNCQWFFDPDGNDWVLIAGGCRSNHPSNAAQCRCPKPSYPAAPCSVTSTQCYSPDVTVSTTTPTPTACTGSCWWLWNGTAWVFDRTNCPSYCACAAKPPYSGISTCETAMTGCDVTTSTTTSTTTTCAPTTTTTPPSCGYCRWEWIPTGEATGFWQLTNNYCTSVIDCACNPPENDGDTGCNRIAFSSCVEQCSTTTCAPYEWEPAEDSCGTCVYRAVQVHGETCPTWEWQLFAGTCWNGCSCDTPPECVPTPVNGQTVFATVNCVNPTTTTSTSTSTTTEPPCTTSTTTTASPPPCGTCQWTWNGFAWVRTLYSCTSGCGCETLPLWVERPCFGETVLTHCGTSDCTTTTTTTASPPTCGQCAWTWVPPFGWAVYPGYGCEGDCTCSPPSGSGDCLDEFRLTHCTSTTTTTTAAPCGLCHWYWTGTDWVSNPTDCTGGCICDTAPGSPGSYVGEIQDLPCV